MWLEIERKVGQGEEMEWNVHGKSGRVALPRVKEVFAPTATLGAVERVRKAIRPIDGRKSAVDIVVGRDDTMTTDW